MSAFDDLSGVAPQQLFPGFLARAVHGEQITMAIIEIDPGVALPEHHHANEQLGMVIRGSLVLRVGGEERVLGPGETWRISSDTPHTGRGGPEGAVVLDVFSPPREDWQAHELLAPRPPIWP